MKMKKWLALLLSVLMLVASMSMATLPALAESADDEVILLSASDFQVTEFGLGKTYLADMLRQMRYDGITEFDGLLFSGDYTTALDNKVSDSVDGYNQMMEILDPYVGDHRVFVKGNHDPSGCDFLSPSGANDAEKYGVFVINESDFRWGGAANTSNGQAVAQAIAAKLDTYLNEKISSGYDKPIFVMSHVPLHYTMRTQLQGDGDCANYIFDVLNAVGDKLNIIFLFGHDHNNGYDDYVGGGAVYLKKGDSINIAQGDKMVFKPETLKFTYMNSGYVAYYSSSNVGACKTLTMSVFRIKGNEVTVARYSRDGLFDMKAAGVRNESKNEIDYDPDPTVYGSPRLITLTDDVQLEDTTPPADTTTVPSAYLNSYGTNNNQTYKVTVDGLTVGETYTMKMLYKPSRGAVHVSAGEKDIMVGSEVANGATYDYFSGTLSYKFLAESASLEFGIRFDAKGTYHSAYIGPMLVEAFDGTNLYKLEGVYTDGKLTGFANWKNSASWASTVTFEEKLLTYYGVEWATWDTPVHDVPACDHVYDDKYDAECNTCGKMRPTPVPGKVYGITAEGWTNEDTQGFGMNAKGLTPGETYTVSFLWMVDQGVPQVRVSGLGDAFNIVENRTALNGATYNEQTGRVSYTFVAQDKTVGVKAVMNTASTGKSKYHIADMKFTDAAGNVVKEGGFTDFDGWANNWANWQGGKWKAFDESFFACYHTYDDESDGVCNGCGFVRKVAVVQFRSYNATTQTYGVTIKNLTAGATYTVSMFYKTGEGAMMVTHDKTTVLVDGTTLQNGTTYSASGRISYTFTADDADALFRIESSPNGLKTYNSATIGYLVLKDADGNVVYASEGKYDADENLTALNGWGSSWGNVTLLTFSEQEMSFFACAHAFDSDFDATCNKCDYVRPISTEIPVAYMYYYSGAANQQYSTTINGLTPNGAYTLSMYFKRTLRYPAIVVDGVTIISGVEAQNGATYDAATGLLTYPFRSGGSSTVTLCFPISGGYTDAYIGGLTLVDSNGTVVHSTTGDTTNGLTGWSGTNSKKYLTFTMEDITFFGAANPNTCAHTYTNACDPFCNACGMFRSAAHVYTDDTDSLCNVCGELQLPNIGVIYGAEMYYYVSAADQYYGRDYSELTVGETYTFSVFTKNLASSGFSFNGEVILHGDVASGGAVYDATTGLLTYTFTATDTDNDGDADAWFKLELLSGSGYQTAQMAHPTVTDADGNVVVASAPRYLDGVYKGIDGWKGSPGYGVSNGNYQYVTAKAYDSTIYGLAPECFHRYEDGCDATCDYCDAVREAGHVYDNACDAECNVCGDLREVGHAYDNDCDAECNLCGGLREAGHTYDNGCDADCNLCGATRTVGDHVYSNDFDTDCDECGFIREVTVPYIVIDGVEAKAGDTIEVPIRLVDNPGIVSMVIDVAYDSTVLELIDSIGGNYDGNYSYSQYFTKNPYRINWYNALITEDIVGDDVFATLVFKVKDDAPDGEYGFTITYKQENVYNFDFEDVVFATDCGTVKVETPVATHTPGDINGDGAVNNRDYMTLTRHLNEWDVEVVEAALDITNDGVVNNRDAMTLNRYLNEWDVAIY